MDISILRKVQLSQCIILDEIDRICNKYGITYYLAGGTLLGAVRHKGFIPWDDDLDVSMPREEYEKFAEVCKQELSEDFFYQSIDVEPNYNLFLAKIRLNNTKLVDVRIKDLDINQGIYVDIFPLDYTKKRGSILKLRAKLFNVFAKLKAVKIGTDQVGGMKKKILVLVAKILTTFFSVNFINNITMKLLKGSKSGNYFANFCSQYGYKKQTMPCEWFGKGTKLSFEGKEYNVPIEYDKVLTSIYNDYMKLPPVEKRVTVHDFIEVYLGKWEENVKERMK